MPTCQLTQQRSGSMQRRINEFVSEWLAKRAQPEQRYSSDDIVAKLDKPKLAPPFTCGHIASVVACGWWDGDPFPATAEHLAHELDALTSCTWCRAMDESKPETPRAIRDAALDGALLGFSFHPSPQAAVPNIHQLSPTVCHMAPPPDIESCPPHRRDISNVGA